MHIFTTISPQFLHKRRKRSEAASFLNAQILPKTLQSHRPVTVSLKRQLWFVSKGLCPCKIHIVKIGPCTWSFVSRCSTLWKHLHVGSPQVFPILPQNEQISYPGPRLWASPLQCPILHRALQHHAVFPSRYPMCQANGSCHHVVSHLGESYLTNQVITCRVSSLWAGGRPRQRAAGETYPFQPSPLHEPTLHTCALPHVCVPHAAVGPLALSIKPFSVVTEAEKNCWLRGQPQKREKGVRADGSGERWSGHQRATQSRAPQTISTNAGRCPEMLCPKMWVETDSWPWQTQFSSWWHRWPAQPGLAGGCWIGCE